MDKATKRIDGIVATVMGLGRALLDEGEFILLSIS